MSYWLLSSGKNVFQFSECMKKYGFVYWNQQNKVQVDDLILIYISAPIGVCRCLIFCTIIRFLPTPTSDFSKVLCLKKFWLPNTYLNTYLNI